MSAPHTAECCNTELGQQRGNTGSELLRAVITEISISWDITPCTPSKDNICFGGKNRILLHGKRISQARNQRETGSKETLQNVGWLSADYMALYSTRQNSPKKLQSLKRFQWQQCPYVESAIHLLFIFILFIFIWIRGLWSSVLQEK
jgi:hypothetical protein